MTFEQLMREPQHLLLKCVSGSRAYNLALPTSDTDLKGVFLLPQKELYGLSYTPQVSNESNDEVFYEAGRFIDLLSKNNPNILELLSTPPDHVLYRHPLMDLIKPEDFLSKLCMDTFAGYARTQVKKARGLNKKINRSFERDRKSVLDFCYVVEGNGTVPLRAWLSAHQLRQEDCGLAALAHFRDAYQIYHQEPGVHSTPALKSDLTPGPAPEPAPNLDPTRGPENPHIGAASPRSEPAPAFRGIVSDVTANDVQLSSIPKGLPPLAVMHFNKDGYSLYCREYKEYWDWTQARNEERYQSTLRHGQNYDAKNMMHTFRLLAMAEEIARHHQVIVHRPDRDFLLRIRAGEFSFEDLMLQVESRLVAIETLYAQSDLPEAPASAKAEKLLIHIRERFYADRH
ncbi:MAG TPA: nucleotidyltransferase domain-containing protein [Puia sp.]|nr:nucleotidyltransferase domain-containing protein [Puia sp.]